MHTRLVVIAICAAMLAAGVAAAQNTAYFYPTDDAYVDSASPSTNYGSSLNLYVGDRTPAGGGTAMSFVQFNISDLGSGEILNAELWLYKHEKYGSQESMLTIGVHHITTPGWNEMAVTWNAPPGYATAATAAITDYFNPPGWVHYNVTADVAGDYLTQDFIGWCVKQTPPAPWLWVNFWSSEQVPMPDYRPMLEVTYNGPVAVQRVTSSAMKMLYR